jgi:hypothetical protein
MTDSLSRPTIVTCVLKWTLSLAFIRPLCGRGLGIWLTAIQMIFRKTRAVRCITCNCDRVECIYHSSTILEWLLSRLAGEHVPQTSQVTMGATFRSQRSGKQQVIK